MAIRIGYPRVEYKGQPVKTLSDEVLLETWHMLRLVASRGTIVEPTSTELYLHDVQEEIERRLKLRSQIDVIRDKVWGIDVPSHTTPEGREWHEKCKKILNYIDNLEADNG